MGETYQKIRHRDLIRKVCIYQIENTDCVRLKDCFCSSFGGVTSKDVFPGTTRLEFKGDPIKFVHDSDGMDKEPKRIKACSDDTLTVFIPEKELIPSFSGPDIKDLRHAGQTLYHIETGILFKERKEGGYVAVGRVITTKNNKMKEARLDDSTIKICKDRKWEYTTIYDASEYV